MAYTGIFIHYMCIYIYIMFSFEHLKLHMFSNLFNGKQQLCYCHGPGMIGRFGFQGRVWSHVSFINCLYIGLGHD